MAEYFPTPTDEKENVTPIQAEPEAPVKPAHRPYAVWNVDGKTYKLKLTTSAIMELESRYKVNLLTLTSMSDDGLPAISIMLDIAFAAVKKYHASITRKDMPKLFDAYIEEGGSQLSFYTDVFMPIFAVSGFFTKEAAEELQSKMEEIQGRA
jgi:hypothetical protein